MKEQRKKLNEESQTKKRQKLERKDKKRRRRDEGNRARDSAERGTKLTAHKTRSEMREEYSGEKRREKSKAKKRQREGEPHNGCDLARPESAIHVTQHVDTVAQRESKIAAFNRPRLRRFLVGKHLHTPPC